MLTPRFDGVAVAAGCELSPSVLSSLVRLSGGALDTRRMDSPSASGATMLSAHWQQASSGLALEASYKPKPAAKPDVHPCTVSSPYTYQDYDATGAICHVSVGLCQRPCIERRGSSRLAAGAS